MNKTYRKELGDRGEELAKKFLRKKGYKNVKNLNDLCQNFPYADIYAEKEGGKFIISVKTRNKIGANGKKNKFYNLSYEINHKMINFAKKHLKLKPYWIAIKVDESEKKYSICFGSLASLKEKNAIPIEKCLKGEIRGCCVEKGNPLPKDWVKKSNEIKY